MELLGGSLAGISILFVALMRYHLRVIELQNLVRDLEGELEDYRKFKAELRKRSY